jgi:hypothetical protein
MSSATCACEPDSFAGDDGGLLARNHVVGHAALGEGVGEGLGGASSSSGNEPGAATATLELAATDAAPAPAGPRRPGPPRRRPCLRWRSSHRRWRSWASRVQVQVRRQPSILQWSSASWVSRSAEKQAAHSRDGRRSLPVRCISASCAPRFQVQVLAHPGVRHWTSRSASSLNCARCSSHMRSGGGWPKPRICCAANQVQVCWQPAIRHGTCLSCTALNSDAVSGEALSLRRSSRRSSRRKSSRRKSSRAGPRRSSRSAAVRDRDHPRGAPHGRPPGAPRLPTGRGARSPSGRGPRSPSARGADSAAHAVARATLTRGRSGSTAASRPPGRRLARLSPVRTLGPPELVLGSSATAQVSVRSGPLVQSARACAARGSILWPPRFSRGQEVPACCWP